MTGCGTQYLGGDRDTRWQKDLNYLKEAIKNKDSYAYDKVGEDEFNNKIDELKEEAANLNDDEIVTRIYEITASIGDAHTKAYKHFTKASPVQFYYFKDGFYLINTIDEYKDSLYCKLKKINNMDIEEVVKKLEPLIAHENEANIKKTMPNLLMRPEILHGVNIIDNIDDVNFTFENLQGNEFDMQIKTIDSEKDDNVEFVNSDYDETYPLYMQQSNLNYWYKYLDDKKTLYFKYNESSFDKESGSIDNITEEMIKLIDDGKVDKFIIDMRNNSGGITDLFDKLIERIKESNLNKKDKFYVIVGRETFSSAILDVCNIREQTNATIIGEPTSMRPNHYAEVTSFELPNSKISISCSTSHVNKYKDDGDSVIPDKIIQVSIEDYINKKDPVLESIYN